MRALLITTDLLIAAHVEGAAKRRSAELKVAGAVQQMQYSDFDLILVDLGAIASSLDEQLHELRTNCPTHTKLLAFGPHVHRTRLDAARAAGFDLVLSRGEFHARVDQLLSG